MLDCWVVEKRHVSRLQMFARHRRVCQAKVDVGSLGSTFSAEFSIRLFPPNPTPFLLKIHKFGDITPVDSRPSGMVGGGMNLRCWCLLSVLFQGFTSSNVSGTGRLICLLRWTVVLRVACQANSEVDPEKAKKARKLPLCNI